MRIFRNALRASWVLRERNRQIFRLYTGGVMSLYEDVNATVIYIRKQMNNEFRDNQYVIEHVESMLSVALSNHEANTYAACGHNKYKDTRCAIMSCWNYLGKHWEIDKANKGI